MTTPAPAADCEPDWNNLTPPDPRLNDLHGQGLTAVQLHRITDIEITEGSYL